MSWIAILVAACLLLALVLALKHLKPPTEDTTEWPFYARAVLSQPEQVLYFQLVKALPEHIVLAQVQLSRLLGVKRGNNFQSWMNRINRMSADFVICSKDAKVVTVIELDDKSHESVQRMVADQKKEKALTAAGLPILRWRVNALPDEGAIAAMILQPQRPAAHPRADETAARETAVQS